MDLLNFYFSGNQITYIIQISLAILAGGIVGYNRQRNEKPAGMRTFILVCMGTTLLSIISKNYHLLTELPATTIQPMQLAASALVGIGFLGGGVIFHKKNKIEGVTTAASLWMVAAIGIAIGFEFYLLAIYTTCIAFLVIGFLWRYSDGITKRYRKKRALMANNLRGEDN